MPSISAPFSPLWQLRDPELSRNMYVTHLMLLTDASRRATRRSAQQRRPRGVTRRSARQRRINYTFAPRRTSLGKAVPRGAAKCTMWQCQRRVSTPAPFLLLGHPRGPEIFWRVYLTYSMRSTNVWKRSIGFRSGAARRGEVHAAPRQ
ncbi:hypothetical protein C8F04DRAFT_1184855 [Mycena alexandri]|uniref:Uncharacterized protein n=1 Tax=Mycena alexandri TaxID=1745969 RepID=A0AAD6X5A9_9AGAR|nr:hypothetical protein C8F04DRAFT_1184855 [Mycena alexandri]